MMPWVNKGQKFDVDKETTKELLTSCNVFSTPAPDVRVPLLRKGDGTLAYIAK